MTNPMTARRNKGLPKAIKIFRAKKNLTQKDLAECIGKSIKHISMVEAGRVNLSEDDIHQIETKFGETLLVGSDQIDVANRLLTTDQFCVVQKNYFLETNKLIEDMDGSCGNKLDLWFVNPEDLPVYTEESYRRTWISALENGSNYNLIWNFNNNGMENLRSLFKVFEPISCEDPWGRIIVWPFVEDYTSKSSRLVDLYCNEKLRSLHNEKSIFDLKNISVLGDSKEFDEFSEKIKKKGGIAGEAYLSGLEPKAVKIVNKLLYNYHFDSMAMVAYVPRFRSSFIKTKVVIELDSVGVIGNKFSSEDSESKKCFMILGDKVGDRFDDLICDFREELKQQN